MSRAHSSAGTANTALSEDNWVFLLLCFPSSAESGKFGHRKASLDHHSWSCLAQPPSNPLSDLGHVTNLPGSQFISCKGGMCDMQRGVC